MMNRLCLCALLVSALLCTAPGKAAEPAMEESDGGSVTEGRKPGWGHRLLYYLPNRILDLTDILRLRARVGPGLAVSARATENVSFYGGTGCPVRDGPTPGAGSSAGRT